MFIFLSLVFSMIIPIDKSTPFSTYADFSDNTVVLAKATIMIRHPHTGAWIEADDSIIPSINLKVTYDENVCLEDTKYVPHAEFFLITYKGAGTYNFFFKVDMKSNEKFGLKLGIFRGSPQNTEITSSIDYHIKDINKNVTGLLDFARSNIDSEELGNKREKEYINLYNTMFGLVYKTSLLKIIVLFITIFYINTSVKSFFITQKIAK